MIERGILFSGEMVRALLDGRKTQTRRLVKLPPAPTYRGGWEPTTIGGPTERLSSGETIPEQGAIWNQTNGTCIACPHGGPGDRMWVRETWSTGVGLDDQSPAEIGRRALGAGYAYPWAPLKYTVDGYEADRQSLVSFGGAWGKTRVSIHMPRWASRITLEVVSVRVQRLQDISAADAIAEGIREGVDFNRCHCEACGMTSELCTASQDDAVCAFARLWDAINAERAPWSSNPWVWAVEFKRVEP